jgi:paraquat-inducible protein B
MSQKANTVIVGLFVVGAVGLLVAAAFFISGAAFGEQRTRALLVFDGSVKGLKVGAPVAFKGVQIGQVTKIDLLLDTTTYEVMMPVEIELVTGRIKRVGENVALDSTQPLVDRGMRGQLQLQSLLTGLLYVQMDFYPGSELRYSNIDSDLPELPTIPTDLERISRSLDQFDFSAALNGLDNIVSGLDKIINSSASRQLPANLNQSLDSMNRLTDQLQGDLAALTPVLTSLVGNTDVAVQDFNRDLATLTQGLEKSLAELDGTLAAARTTLDNVDYTLSEDSAVLYDVREASRELARAGRALQRLAETLEERPESILRGKSPLGN